MPLAAYSDLSWLIRAVRVLPVVAVAATVGGIIGGFTIFAIDSALTWQPRPEFRADSQAAMGEQQGTRPVRIVGGAIPDPSAGMSAPPPAPRQRGASTQPAQMPAQLLTAKPLGAAQPLTQTKTQAQTPQSQPPAASAQPIPSQSPNAAAGQQQSTRWPDALSRARQTYSGAQQQTEAPQPNATPEPSTDKSAERKNSGDERAVSADDEDRASRRGRRGRRFDARAYDRFYNSYGYARERDEAGSGGSRYDAERRYGHYSHYRGRSREIVPERQDVDRGQADRGQADREQAIETPQPRSEPFWGGGFIRRDDRLSNDD
jgi:hypothetical protein